MFDFQTIRYASPMSDLSTFMANSSGVDVRSKHFNDIFSAYYSALVDNYLVRSNTKIEDLPPYFR